MFGIISKLEVYTVTILIQGCCTIKLQKYFLGEIETPIEVGLKVYFVAESVPKFHLPKLAMLHAQDFDNCSECGKSNEISDAQVVSFILPLLNYT